MTISAQKIYLGELNDTPLGDLRLVASNFGLLAIEWAESQPELDSLLLKLNCPVEINQTKLKSYAKEVLEYLKGERREFTFPIDWDSLKPFQQKSLKAVYKIPYGETRTYLDIAVEIGHPNAPRAVGRANATNPMPLVIPCHRLVGKDGKLHGYGGGEGLKTKEWLLKMEGTLTSRSAYLANVVEVLKTFRLRLSTNTKASAQREDFTRLRASHSKINLFCKLSGAKDT